MKRYEYPGYYEYRPVVLDGLHCVRCSKLFQLEDDGEYTIPERSEQILAVTGLTNPSSDRANKS